MVNCLSTVRPGIDDSAITLTQSLCSCDFSCGPVKMAEQLRVRFLRIGDGRDMLSRHDEYMDRCLRLHIREGIAVIVLIDCFRWNASLDDLAEYAAHDSESIGGKVAMKTNVGCGSEVISGAACLLPLPWTGENSAVYLQGCD